MTCTHPKAPKSFNIFDSFSSHVRHIKAYSLISPREQCLNDTCLTNPSCQNKNMEKLTDHIIWECNFSIAILLAKKKKGFIFKDLSFPHKIVIKAKRGYWKHLLNIQHVPSIWLGVWPMLAYFIFIATQAS